MSSDRRVDYRLQPRKAGNWFFEFPGSWVAQGSFATREEAIAAGREFRGRGTTRRDASIYVGQWEERICLGVSVPVREEELR